MVASPLNPNPIGPDRKIVPDLPDKSSGGIAGGEGSGERSFSSMMDASRPQLSEGSAFQEGSRSDALSPSMQAQKEGVQQDPASFIKDAPEDLRLKSLGNDKLWKELQKADTGLKHEQPSIKELRNMLASGENIHTDLASIAKILGGELQAPDSKNFSDAMKEKLPGLEGDKTGENSLAMKGLDWLANIDKDMQKVAGLLESNGQELQPKDLIRVQTMLQRSSEKYNLLSTAASKMVEFFKTIMSMQT